MQAKTAAVCIFAFLFPYWSRLDCVAFQGYVKVTVMVLGPGDDAPVSIINIILVWKLQIKFFLKEELTEALSINALRTFMWPFRIIRKWRRTSCIFVTKFSFSCAKNWHKLRKVYWIYSQIDKLQCGRLKTSWAELPYVNINTGAERASSVRSCIYCIIKFVCQINVKLSLIDILIWHDCIVACKQLCICLY